MYYDDALQAAWMAREFGVKFKSGFALNEKIEDRFILEDIDAKQKYKLIVHPDSLAIFGIQRDDLVQWTVYKGKGVFHERTYTENAHDELIKALNSGDKSVSDIKIIQRQGKHFFIPKKD